MLTIVTLGLMLSVDMGFDKQTELERRAELCGDLTEFRVAFGHLQKLDKASESEWRDTWNLVADTGDEIAGGAKDYFGTRDEAALKASQKLGELEKLPGDLRADEIQRRVSADMPKAAKAYDQLRAGVDCQ